MYLEYLIMLANLEEEIDWDLMIMYEDYDSIMYHIDRLKTYLRMYA